MMAQLVTGRNSLTGVVGNHKLNMEGSYDTEGSYESAAGIYHGTCA